MTHSIRVLALGPLDTDAKERLRAFFPGFEEVVTLTQIRLRPRDIVLILPKVSALSDRELLRALCIIDKLSEVSIHQERS